MNKEEVVKLLNAKALAAITDLEEAVGERIKRYHAKGPRTTHKRGKTLGQKARNSGVDSAKKRSKSGIKGVKTKRKQSGVAVPLKTLRKISRAKAKRPGV